ncbi:MAG TPA: hypothetical protein VNF99_09975 [Stellaceae bacterium]|nr:hypothetical protein [Stellaceae bacterium]
MGDIQPVVGRGAGFIRGFGDPRAGRDILRQEVAAMRLQIGTLMAEIRRLAADSPEVNQALDGVLAELADLWAASDAGQLSQAENAIDRVTRAVQALQQLARLRGYDTGRADA